MSAGAAAAPESIDGGLILAEPGAAGAAAFAGTGGGRIRFAEGRIAAVEPGRPSPGGEGLLLLPALANAHDHGWGLSTLAFGAADDALELWMPDLSRNPRVDPYLRALVAFARMAESGICVANHCHNTQNSDALVAEAQGVSRAAADVGVRVAFAMPFFDRNATVYGDRTKLLDTLEPADRAYVAAPAMMRPMALNFALMDEIAAFEHPLFSLQYGPVAPQWAENATLAAIAEASALTGRRVHMHLLETKRQREWADAHYPDGLLNFLDTLGLLSPRLSVAHGVWLRPGEYELMAERGVSVSVNSSSNLRLRSGRAAMADMVAAGVNVGVGLDGLSLDDDNDMLRELRLAWRLNAGDGLAPAITPAAVLDVACRTGRRSILGDDGGGGLAPGAPADLLAVDFAALTYDCVGERLDPRYLLLARGAKRHVARLIVAGREIVRDARCLSVDLPAAEAALIEAARSAVPDVDGGRIGRLQQAVAGYYGCGLHCELSEPDDSPSSP
jgi:cytosine/adenosine deaminase-related metal-dependent hydrolase